MAHFATIKEYRAFRDSGKVFIPFKCATSVALENGHAELREWYLTMNASEKEQFRAAYPMVAV